MVFSRNNNCLGQIHSGNFSFHLTWIMHEPRRPQMRGAEGEAVLVALRTLRNKADTVGSARPKGKNVTCF